MNEIEKFEYFMTLANAYHEQYSEQEHFFNYFQYVPIDLLIAILENAKEQPIEMFFDFPKAGQVIFKGFRYLELAF